ncbi:hypothetical protein BD410DRAFT_835231 [Rickenella mellea]|uniref:Uncharacterized protein n=1 Tax=Rickenella mellea TaxID=50990 RepID=A0A4Y7QJZ4_9AGAM|nr:hypothetical protein BD410DRAFT_835231 [Rickenella mellea]
MSSSLIAHNFSSDVNELTRADSSFTNSILLARAEHLVASASSSKGWRDVVAREADRTSVTPGSVSMCSNTRLDIDNSRFTAFGKAFAYKLPPPRIVHARRQGTELLEEWDTTVSSHDDIFSLEALEAFQSTDLGYLTTNTPSAETRDQQLFSYDGARRSRRTAASPETQSERPMKIPRTEGRCSLFSLIPQPHHHAYPPVIPSMPDNNKLSLLKPYSKAPVVPIPPYTTKLMREFLLKPFARSAWIIPVRGTLPWSQSSPALFSESEPLVDQASERKIVRWTTNSLQAFWTFLITVRKLQTLGILSLSFHAAPTDSKREGLLGCDHIKLFHDTTHALQVRTLLDSWRYDKMSPDTDPLSFTKAGDRPKVKLKPLESIKLVLVDESCQGVAVC